MESPFPLPGSPGGPDQRCRGRHGPPLPWPPQDLQAFWQDWISRGWFAWEREGYPYWGNLHHTTTWWQFRHLENILFVHFNDLLTDLRTEISRIARFLDLAYSAETIAEIAQAVTFSAMKRNAKQFVPGAETGWTGGSETFIFKGTNGRWKEVLTQADLARYTDIVASWCRPRVPPGWSTVGQRCDDTGVPLRAATRLTPLPGAVPARLNGRRFGGVGTPPGSR